MSSTSSNPTGKDPFFIIGAQRCGTTYLYELLEGHPDIAMAKPKRPEPKWFLDPAKVQLGREAWESRLFQGVSGKTLGEKGTSYIEHPSSANAILSIFPRARFLVILREPVARAVSNYRFSRGNGLEQLPIEQALTPMAEERSFDRTKISTSPYAYLHRGLYAEHLEAWAERIPSGRLHIVILEELLGDGSLSGLWDFLGLPPFHPPNMDQVVNAAVEPMPEFPADLRSELKEYFSGPNRRLEKFLGRPLNAWRG